MRGVYIDCDDDDDDGCQINALEMYEVCSTEASVFLTLVHLNIRFLFPLCFWYGEYRRDLKILSRYFLQHNCCQSVNQLTFMYLFDSMSLPTFYG